MAVPNVCQVVGKQRICAEAAPPEERVRNFAEVEPTLSLEQAIAEAKRCTAANPCYFCDVCQLLCPDLAITRDLMTNQIEIDLNYCKGCGLCAHYCPHGAIKMVVDD